MNKFFYNYLIESGVKETHIIKLNLEYKRNSKYLDPDELDNFVRNKIIDDDRYYALIDEVQLVNNFEFVLNGLLDIDNLDTYVTGSNSKFLSIGDGRDFKRGL